MKEREYLKLREKIEKEYREKLKALELVWEMAKDNNQITSHVGLTTNGKKKLTTCVRDVLEKYEGKFDLKDVQLWVSEIYHDEIKMPTLSNILKRMAVEGKIHTIEIGSGSRPTRYFKGEVGSREYLL